MPMGCPVKRGLDPGAHTDQTYVTPTPEGEECHGPIQAHDPQEN